MARSILHTAHLREGRVRVCVTVTEWKKGGHTMKQTAVVVIFTYKYFFAVIFF